MSAHKAKVNITQPVREGKPAKSIADGAYQWSAVRPTRGGKHEAADPDVRNRFDGYDRSRRSARRGLPEELPAGQMLPHGQQHWSSSLSLTSRRAGCLAATVLLSFVIQALAEPLMGRASVVDGDTIEIGGQRIRFDGIDAPESWQHCQDATGADYRCGAVAANALDEFLAGSRPTACKQVSRDRYRRIVAICVRADGSDVASWLVREGHALDWPKYSKGRYAQQQRAAEASKRGMWAGSFLEPWVARANR